MLPNDGKLALTIPPISLPTQNQHKPNPFSTFPSQSSAELAVILPNSRRSQQKNVLMILYGTDLKVLIKTITYIYIYL